MEFIISSSALLKHLQSISGVLNSSSNLPILENFLFEVDGEHLTISASDLDTTMRTTVELSSPSSVAGKIAIPSKLLIEVLRNLPEQPCNFSIDEETFGIEIKYENGKSRMAGYSGDEFPKIPVIENSKSIKINGEVITKAINTTSFATGNDDLRRAMMGVYCSFSQSDIIFVATDSHKFAHYKRTDVNTEEVNGSAFILPKKPLKLLTSNLSDDMEVLVEYNESNVVFSFGDIVLVCRLIDGTYPDWMTAIPKEISDTIIVDRQQLLGALKRVSVFANKSSHTIQFKLKGSELTVSAEDRDYHNEASERLMCNYSGENRLLGFNGRNLLDMLSVLQSKDVHLELSVEARPILIRPSENANEHEEAFMITMPVALSNVEYA